MQVPGKLMNQISQKGKKPNFGIDFDPFGPSLPPPPKFVLWILSLLVARHLSKLSSYAISRCANESNFRKSRKT